MIELPPPTIATWIPIRVTPKQGGVVRVEKRYGKYIGQPHQTTRVKENARQIIAAMKMVAPSEPITNPVLVSAVYMSPRRTKDPKGVAAIGKATAPDADNLSKQLLDCIESAGWVRCDGQVVELRVIKVVVDTEGVYVTVTEMPKDFDYTAALLEWYNMVPIEELN